MCRGSEAGEAGGERVRELAAQIRSRMSPLPDFLGSFCVRGPVLMRARARLLTAEGVPEQR